MSAFNWLHLTDLHWGQTGQKHLWPEIREQCFDDLKTLRDKCGPWQAVLFSGDFVQQGKAEEFEQLEQEVLGPLWETLNHLDSGNAVLLAVPGNHDLRRPELDKAGDLKSAVRLLLKPEQFAEIADEVFDHSDSHERQVIDNAFANFMAWWSGKPHRADHLIQNGGFPGDFSTTFEVDGQFRVGVVGLNSTFLQLAGGDYHGKLALDLRQFHAACKSEGGPQDGPAWAKQHDVCLLMTHQGLDWLDDASRNDVYSQINPAGRFAVHQFGHMHEEIIRGETSRGGPMRRFWQGNSLFSRERYEGQKCDERRHGYAAASLSFHGDHAMLRHWPRKAVTDTANGWRFIPDGEGCILQDDVGTKPERIDLARGKADDFPAPTPESLEQTTERVLAAYHRTVQQSWDDRWSRVITDDAADE